MQLVVSLCIFVMRFSVKPRLDHSHRGFSLPISHQQRAVSNSTFVIQSTISVIKLYIFVDNYNLITYFGSQQTTVWELNMTYETIEIDELKIPLGDGQYSIVAIASGLKGDFEWIDGAWKCDRLDLKAEASGEWVSIEDNPAFAVWVEGAELYANTGGIAAPARRATKSNPYEGLRFHHSEYGFFGRAS